MRTHGIDSTYTWGCHCELCSAAHSAEMKRQKAERSLASDDERHGSENGYLNYRCRCPDCTEAHRIKRKLRRHRTRRRARRHGVALTA